MRENPANLMLFYMDACSLLVILYIDNYQKSCSICLWHIEIEWVYYSKTRIKCSRLISSLLGLQGQKFFADAIIKILIPTKSIIEKNCYDQLFINEVVKIFTFQFDENVTKFYVVKVSSILMKFS